VDKGLVSRLQKAQNIKEQKNNNWANEQFSEDIQMANT
jgi:hypothetical protein